MEQLWYFKAFVEQVYKAVVEEKIPVIGYTAWSFLDNYEWGSYGPRFGMYHMNLRSRQKSIFGIVFDFAALAAMVVVVVGVAVVLNHRNRRSGYEPLLSPN
ncbi:hypothetical protein PHYBOEH_008701 [Phytophthora boehmeriae]|uniref:Glycoside hydrolase n=1 Tax=Phytophthora boehmeriae TaxID=109152 RepID=A0A8T1VYB2_9STRA|nr:hypothetical protein PHYBOEH_008701 [Phytophthora boehmeriae]